MNARFTTLGVTIIEHDLLGAYSDRQAAGFLMQVILPYLYIEGKSITPFQFSYLLGICSCITRGRQHLVIDLRPTHMQRLYGIVSRL